MKRSEIIKIVLSIIVILAVFYYLDYQSTFDVLTNVTWEDFLRITGLTFLGYASIGLQTHFMLRKQHGLNLSFTDIILLPISMSLFAHIIPTNGGIIYSAYFLQAKYNVKASSGVSFGVVLLYISFVVTGLFGVVTFFLIQDVSCLILLLSFVLFLSPFLVMFCNLIFQKITFQESSFFGRIQNFVNELVLSANILMKDYKILLINTVLTLLYLGVTYLTFYLLNDALGMGVSGSGIFMILVITRVSSLIRILPGNIGVQEFFLGGVFKFVGSTTAMGLVFSILIRLTTIVLFVPLGILHFALNYKHMSFVKLRDQIKGQKSSK